MDSSSPSNPQNDTNTITNGLSALCTSAHEQNATSTKPHDATTKPPRTESQHDHKSPDDGHPQKEEKVGDDDEVKEAVRNEEEEGGGGLLTAGILPRHEIKQFTVDEEQIHNDCIPLTWSNCDATSFSVRRGPDYVSGQKAPSKRALYTIFAVDAYTTSRKIQQIWKYVDIAKHIAAHSTPYDADKWALPPLFMLNVMIPNYTPELMGGKDDGEGMSVIVYAHISPATRAQLDAHCADPQQHGMDAAVSLLQQFMHCDLVRSELRNRFKVLCRLMNPKHTDFGFLANRLVSRYNAKPFLARTSSTFYHEAGQYFAADIDVHRFGYPARQGLSYMKEQLATAVYDLGMTIEGHSNDELPEQILACCRVSKMGFDNALPFPKRFMDRFLREQEHKEQQHQMDTLNGPDHSGNAANNHKVQRSESTGDLMNGNKVKNGKIAHAQSARNVDSQKRLEAETKRKGDKAGSGSWGSVFRWGQ